MNTKSNIDEFLAKKNIALFGVSRSKKKFGDTIFKELKSKNYNIIPLNPNIETYNEQKCFSNIKDINTEVDAAVLVVKPEVTEKIIPGIIESGIKNIWMQQGSVSDKAVAYCREHEVNLVYNECILMFAEPVKSIHCFHRWLWKLLNKLPK
ncbi:MAG: CoA-binding protein [Melioribacteraceae bacterium]|nr:CoA-binding protein [Melioribacteraceae bacterium]